MKSRIVATVLQAKKSKCSIVASEQWKLDVPFQIHVTNAFILQVLPSEKEMKQDLMNNAIYNEYNVEELQTTFRYVRGNEKYCLSQHSHNYILPFQINWKMLLSGLFPQPPQPHDVLIVHNPTYLRKLGRIIALFGKR